MTINDQLDIDIEESCGNVFEDIGFDKETSARLTYKSGLVGSLHRAFVASGLNQSDFGKLVGIPQPRLSKLFNGKIDGVSAEKLFDAVARLGGHVTIRIDEAPTPALAGNIDMELVIDQDNRPRAPMAA